MSDVRERPAGLGVVEPVQDKEEMQDITICSQEVTADTTIAASQTRVAAGRPQDTLLPAHGATARQQGLLRLPWLREAGPVSSSAALCLCRQLWWQGCQCNTASAARRGGLAASLISECACSGAVHIPDETIQIHNKRRFEQAAA